MSKQFPLCEEHARNSHPRTSHDRADELTKTPRLTKILLMVLKYVDYCDGKTARLIGQIMFQDSGISDHVEWPHKVMSRLVEAGWVRREDCDGGLRCFITKAGEQVMADST